MKCDIMKEYTLDPKTFSYFGIAAAIWYPLTWLLAALIDGKWTMWQQAISDLGVSTSMTATVLFNLSMMGTALLGGIFSFGKIFCERRLDRISGILLLCAVPFLAGIGIVNENMGQVHMFTSSLYGIITACAMGVSAAADVYYKKWIFAAGTIVLGIIGLYSLFFLEFTVYEPILTLIGTVWVFFQSIKLYLYGKETKIMIDCPEGQ